MSDPTHKPLPFWLSFLIALAGAGLGYMLAYGILPFQALPFDEWGVARKWVPWFAGWALASIACWIADLHSGVSNGCGKLLTKLRSIGPAFARWLAPHLAAAAKEAAGLGPAPGAVDAELAHEPTSAPQTK